jgi:flagellar hook-length control protein FliK
MGAAIPLLLPQLAPDAELSPSEGEGQGSDADFVAALELELASLPPEIERPTSETGDDMPLPPLPGDVTDGADPAPVDDEPTENPNLPFAVGPAEATAASTRAANAPSGTANAGLPPQAVEPGAADPRSAQTRPGNPAATAPEAQGTRAQTEAALETRPDPLAEASVVRTAEGPAPRARFEATRHADLRTRGAESDARSDPASDVEASRAIRPLANAPLETDPRALQPSAPAPVPVAIPESAPASAWAAANPPLPTVAGSGEVARSELGSPPVPPEGLPLQVEWLAERGGGRARIQLHPPHLGHVELEVRTRGGEVEVVLNVGEAAAHAPLQAQRSALTQALAAHDLELASFEVAERDAGDRRSQQQDSRSPNPDGSHEQRPNRSPAPQPTTIASLTPTRSRDTGIDVRI